MTKKQIKYTLSTDDKNSQNIKEIMLTISTDNSMYLIHRALIQQLTNKRQGTANTKTRSEVRGGGKKPWKQKGTGRARAGSIRSPLWKGGGVTFGPKNKSYNIKLNKKERQLALRTLLYNKSKQTILVENFLANIIKPSSKIILEAIKNLGLVIEKRTHILIIVTSKNKNLYLSTRNFKNIELINADQINIIALLKANKLIITTDALDKINEVYNA